MKEIKYTSVPGIRRHAWPYKSRGTEVTWEAFDSQSEPASRLKTPVNGKTGRWVRREVKPLDVILLEQGRWLSACMAGMREALIEASDQCAVVQHGRQGPLMVSSQVPAGHIAYNEDGFYRNEEEAESEGEDGDGDIGLLEQGDHTCNVVWTKYPQTQRRLEPLKLWIVPDEKFENSTDVEDFFHRSSVFEAWCKAAMPNDTGLKTAAFNTKELLEASNLKSFEERMKHPFSDYARFDEIETHGLKGRSKEGQVTRALAMAKVKLDDDIEWFYQPRMISRLSWNRLRRMLAPGKLERIVKRALDIKPYKVKRTLVETEPTAPVTPKVYDLSLARRLAAFGILKHRMLEPENPLSAVVVWLEDGKGNEIALTENRRGLECRGFCWVMSPVARPKDGGYEIVNPLKQISRMLSRFDCCVINPETKELCGYWPYNLEHLPKMTWMCQNLVQYLGYVMGTYGDMVPATKGPSGPEPTEQAVKTAKSMVVVVFKEEITEVNLRESFGRACRASLASQKALGKPLVLQAGKGSNQQVRKYPLAQESGAPIWANAQADPRRAGNAGAQLKQAFPPKRYRVAYVGGPTKSGVCITPSGIEKQKAEGVFLPRISTEEIPEWERVKSTTLDGTIHLQWMGTAKKMREIGKLVGPDGDKFQPRRYGQASGLSGLVDLIMPVSELKAKGLLHRLKGARWERVEIVHPSGRVDHVHAWIGDIVLHRSGAPSENVPMQKHELRARGADRLCIQSERFDAFGTVEGSTHCGMPRPNLAYARQKIAAVRALAIAKNVNNE